MLEAIKGREKYKFECIDDANISFDLLKEKYQNN